MCLHLHTFEYIVLGFQEDFENTVKNHQRAIDSIRASLAGEVKGRAALAQQKQKLESDLNDLELSLDMANRSNAETQKQLKKHQLHIQVSRLKTF